jgi:hypothetical protein
MKMAVLRDVAPCSLCLLPPSSGRLVWVFFNLDEGNCTSICIRLMVRLRQKFLKDVKIRKEVVVAYFEVISLCSPGKTEENHEKCQPVNRPRFKLNTLRVRV